MAPRSLGNLGQLNLIPETEPDATDSGVTHIQQRPALSGENDLGIKGRKTGKVKKQGTMIQRRV